MKNSDRSFVQYLSVKDGKLTVHESLGREYATPSEDIENGQAVVDEADYVLVFESYGHGIQVDLVEGEVPGREESMVLGYPKHIGM